MNLKIQKKPKKIIAFFDFDGTITKQDSFIDFIKYYYGLHRIILGFIYLAPILLFYKLKIVANYLAKEKTLKYFFGNVSENEFKKKAKEYSLKKITSILRSTASKKINWHRQNKHQIVVVSASIEDWLKPYCQQNNFDLIASKLEIKENKITGKLLGKNCYAMEKVKRIQEKYNLVEYQEIYVYGDSKGDLPMLKLASKNKNFYRCF